MCRLGVLYLLLDSVSEEPQGPLRRGQSGSDQYTDSRELQAHFVYLLAKPFLVPGMALTFPLISVLASQRDFGHIPPLQFREILWLHVGRTQRARSGLTCVLLRIT